ncbi:TIGR04222 domain-containing membrane protein [Erythrobacter sp.]|uniref:TIGR04222 domain-containing membrane protein n=1 Tax=Erythrobacter sp. TaxID=1042 RepID=UPI0025D1C9A1|nr:TIGR04222 domain-containing membrane protein [Erythrobacter sp.]
MQLFSSWTGSDFLLFYAMLLGLGTYAAWWIPAHLRDAGRPDESADPENLAILAGGASRFADSVLADLFARGALVEAGAGKMAVAQRSLPATPAGKDLLAFDAPIALTDARKRLGVHAERIAARLRRNGLLLRSEQENRLRLLSITPFAALLLLGLYRQRAGSALGEPTGFLIALLLLTLALAVFRFVKSDPRTTAGIASVERARGQASRLARAPRPEEAALAVALFGTAVLVGTPWEPVHAMRQQSSGDGGGSGGDTSSDGGGSGCGGGGCGGCGG